MIANGDSFFVNPSYLDEDILFLKDLIGQDSRTENIDGVNKVQEMYLSSLQKIGFKGRLTTNKLIPSGKLLIAQKGNAHALPITFVVHGDTVLGPTKNFNFFYDEANGVINGPGVADIKGGFVVFLKAMTLLGEEFFRHNRIQLVSSPNEETGSLGFHQFFAELAKKSRCVFGLEPSPGGGNIISSRNGNRWYHVKVVGQSAHAGRMGEFHLNASHELSIKIARLHYLNSCLENARLNVGWFQGGDGKFNVVCGHAEAKIDVRFATKMDREELHERIVDIFQDNTVHCEKTLKRCRTTYTIEDDCPPMERSVHNQKLVGQLKGKIRQIERRNVRDIHCGGASDVSHFSLGNAKCLDGLGVIGGALHTQGEYAEIQSFYSRSLVIANFLKENL